jgi:hypothetical protein
LGIRCVLVIYNIRGFADNAGDAEMSREIKYNLEDRLKSYEPLFIDGELGERIGSGSYGTVVYQLKHRNNDLTAIKAQPVPQHVGQYDEYISDDINRQIKELENEASSL